MSRIKNEPKIKNKLIVAIREQLEHRALWLYLICDEAKKEGIDPTSFAQKAISRCGHIHGRKRAVPMRKLRSYVIRQCAEIMASEKCTTAD